MGYVHYYTEPLSSEDRLMLKYREIREGAEAAVYPDYSAREIELMSIRVREAEEREREKGENTHWTSQLEGWDDPGERRW